MEKIERGKFSFGSARELLAVYPRKLCTNLANWKQRGLHTVE